MTQTTMTYFVGVAGQNELFQFGGGLRAVIEARDGDDKVSTRTNGLVDMMVFGGSGRDILELGSGADVIYGDDQNGEGGVDGDPNVIGNFHRDAILGGGNNDTIFSQAGDDVVDGENGNDYINGGLGNDFLQGGSGNDQVHGGAGNDTIFGGNASPVSIPGLTLELFKNGLNDTFINANQTPFIIDSKATAISPTLTNTGNDLLYGGDGNDNISGQDGADLIDGGDGIDTALYSSSAASVQVNLNVVVQAGGEAAGDRLVGIENVSASRFGDRLTGNSLANTLSGAAGNDTLAGGAGNDRLDGGTDADTMSGGAGNDTYLVDDANDVVNENGGSGIDTVASAINFNLGNVARVIGAIENLTLLNVAGALNGIGNTLNNVLIGNNFNNVLNGAAGNDVLRGGLGNDTLASGAGNDVFVFNTAPNTATNRDIIPDFANVAGNNDTFQLDNAVFTQLGANGALNASFFKLSTQVQDVNDFIVYNQATGALVYDTDGNGAGAGVQFVLLSTKPVLTAGDFVVV